MNTKVNNDFYSYFITMFRKYGIKIYMQLLSDNNYDDRTIILAGLPRSGTTWIADLINYKHEHRYIFEPFNPVRWNFFCNSLKCGQYIKPSHEDDILQEKFASIILGKVKDLSIDYKNLSYKKFWFKSRLIKTVCANLYLKYLKVNFPQIQVILLFRHPCASFHSREAIGMWPKIDFSKKIDFFSEELLNDFPMLFQKGCELGEIKTRFERYLFSWCIKYWIPLQQFKRGEIHLAFYENFCTIPEQEIKSLFQFLQEPYDDRVFIQLKKPSSSARPTSAIVTQENLIESWKKNISDHQLERAFEILNLFGLDKIYSKNTTMPNVDNAYNFLK